MEDQPQRANAAQMASRRIKDVKGRGSGRRPGTPSRPSIQNAGNQAPQWAPGMPLANGQTPSQSIGGLFGGSVQAPGTFNFSGVPSFDFSQQKQGNSNGSDISDSGDGSGRFAGDDRATKRQFGGRPTISQNNTTFTGFGSNSQNNAFGESKPSSISSDSTIFKGFGSNPQNNAFGESKPSQPSGGIFSFGSPAPGNQPSPAINFNPPQASPAKPAFTFGASQSTPASPGNSFGSNTSGGQSGNTSFNQNPAQSQGSGFGFGSTASQQQQSTPFQFGSTSAAPASSGITFGAAPTAAAASNPFDNLQNAAPTSSSGLNFSTSSTTAQPTSNLFGTSARPANPSVNFGGSTPAKNMFSSTLFGSSQTSQAPSTPNLFGAVSQPPASSTPFAGFNGATSSAPNPFASKEQSPAPSNNLFGAQASQPASSGNLFGASNAVTSQSGSSGQVNSAVATPTNLFNSPNKPGAGNTLFGSQKQDMSQGNIVGNTDNSSKSTNDLFGNLNKPVDVSVTQPKVNGFSNSPNKSSSLFGSSKPSFSTFTPSLNANPLSSESKDSGKNASNEATANNTKNSPFSFGQTSPTKGSSTAKNIFSSSTSLDLPSTANQPPLSGMFPPLSSTMAENNSNPTTAPKDPNMDPLGGKIDAELTATREVNAIDQIPESDIIKKVPQHRLDQWHNDPEYKRQFCAIYRCRALQNSMAKMFRDLSPTKSGEEAFIQYMRERRRVLKLGQIYREPSWYKGPNGHKRVFDEDSDDSVRPHKRRNQGPYDMQPSMSSQAAKASHGNVTASEPIGQPITNGMSQAGSSQTSNNIPGSPAKKSLFPASGASATESSQTSNKISGSPSKSSFFPSPSAAVTTFSQTSNSSPAKNNFFPTPGAATPAKPTTSSKGKRKAEDELTQDTEQVNPLRAIKTPKLNSASFTPSNGGSSTSAIFKGILNSPSKTPSLQETAKEEQPRFNPFGGIPVPKSPTKSTAEPPSKANAFKPAATPQSNMFSAQGIPSTSKANMFATNGTTASSSPNPFAPKVPSTSTTAPTPANPFQAKPASTSAPVPNPFQLKPAAGGANGATIKPPTFDSLKGSDPMEQFRLQAAKDKKKKLEEQMEKAKDKEWDEDEQSESDFERKWYAKQAEKEKQEQQESANIMKNGPKFQFRPSQDASSSSSKGQDETTTAASNSLFARYTSGNSAANSLNGSRASTPGPIGSSTGSVLDGRGPSQPVKNIFGHLSDTGSGKDDRDDDSDADDEDDSENKDPNYFPTPENGSGPGTPASETGEGIASAKKLNLFGFNNGSAFGTTSTSGASTPGRSLFDRIGTKPIAQPQDDEKPAASKMTGGLFDRISRDANGNPLRHISSEEKENTQPSTSNVFEQPKNPFSGFFNKSSSAPADQTWKQDSPIKFGGSSNTEGQSTPSVSVTAATPTKTPASLFSNLGGLNKPAGSSLFSGLNNSNGPAPSSVGFAFGAAPSATSSLFPSAATSRGTSPGATTDGASDAEADPDAEHHEQINLTSGGPGEEDEEVVHEVRAKALRFETDEEDGKNKWVTAGLGPLRVLKHKDTGVSRVLLRGDPSGKIVLNKGILGNLTYTADAKTVKFLAADGKDLETYLLQVKTPEFASKLADVLNEVKAQN